MADKRKIPIRPGNGGDAVEPAEDARSDAAAEDGRSDAGEAAQGRREPPQPRVAGDGPASGSETRPVPEGADLESVEPGGEAGTDADLAAERDAYRDSLVRMKAEFDNYRKRSQRELGEARERARAAIITEFLPVIDNLDRALNAAEHHEEGKVLEGVRLTHSLFAQLLRREGVEAVDPLGQPFDPHRHEAMMAAPSPEPEGLVTAVLEPGYVMGDQVLRPAKVAVSSGLAEPGA